MEKLKQYKYIIIIVLIILGIIFYWFNINNIRSCTIKGNIGSNNEKIYHTIGCNSYEKTTIDKSKGEKYFCSEQEALKAGWRKALNCK